MIGAMQKFFTSLATLALSLLMALIVWAVATQENDPRDLLLLQIPVQLLGLPADSQISNVPETVEIRVEAPASQLRTLSEDLFTAELNVSGLPAGEHAVPITVRHSLPNLTIDYQAPERASVTIERIVTRQIPIDVEVSGDVALGYQMGEPFVDPSTISVTGPASRVDQLAEARIQLFLDSPREEVIRRRTPTFYNGQGEIASISGLTLNSRDVQVTIPVNQLAGFGVKPIIVDWTGEPATGYRVLNVTAQPDSALVTGRPSVVEAVNFLRTETIDISGLRDSVTVPAALNLPDDLALEDIQSVIVNIEIEPIITTDVIRRAPEIRNLGEGLTVTLSTDEVAVFVAGPFNRLESLTSSDVLVSVDLLGLITGTHRVPVEAVVLDSEVEVRSLQPSEVTAIISHVMTPTEVLTETTSLPVLPLFRSTAPHTQTNAATGGAPQLAADLPPSRRRGNVF